VINLEKRDFFKVGEKYEKAMLLEMLLLRTLIASLQDFGMEKEIMDHLVSKYGERILGFMSENLSFEKFSEESFSNVYGEFLELVLKNAVGSDKIVVEANESILKVTIHGCPHHMGKKVREKLDMDPPSQCPVELLISSILNSVVMEHSLIDRKIFKTEKGYKCKMEFGVRI
jgi:hypothetical protein